jgi:aconitate hydratase
MMRGTFGNIRLKNLLVGGKEGSYTLKFPEKEERYIYEVAMAYQKEKMPAVVLAGKEYGTGSSRDWAAKGSNLLGVRAVITESFERIHRSNLVGMGVLPLVFNPGENASSLGLDGSENFSIEGLAGIQPRQQLTVTAEKSDGSMIDFTVTARLDTDVEVAYFRHGGILPYVLRKIIACKNEKKADSR